MGSKQNGKDSRRKDRSSFQASKVTSYSGLLGQGLPAVAGGWAGSPCVADTGVVPSPKSQCQLRV